MTESLISYRAFNLRHKAAKRLHAFLQLSSLLLGILAFTVVVLFHNANKFPNFYSVHSWLGLSTYILAWSQFIAGFCVFWWPNCGSPSFRAAFLRYHKVGGLIVYTMAIAAAATGLMQKQSFLRKNVPPAPLFGAANILANAAAVLAVVTSCTRVADQYVDCLSFDQLPAFSVRSLWAAASRGLLLHPAHHQQATLALHRREKTCRESWAPKTRFSRTALVYSSATLLLQGKPLEPAAAAAAAAVAAAAVSLLGRRDSLCGGWPECELSGGGAAAGAAAAAAPACLYIVAAAFPVAALVLLLAAACMGCCSCCNSA
ncbi:hypothetical protein Emag_003496 [Eimeria magna]